MSITTPQKGAERLPILFIPYIGLETDTYIQETKSLGSAKDMYSSEEIQKFIGKS